MADSDTDIIRIDRRKLRPTSRVTYWVDHPRLGYVQVNSDRAKSLVRLGKAVWTGEPIVQDAVA